MCYFSSVKRTEMSFRRLQYFSYTSGPRGGRKSKKKGTIESERKRKWIPYLCCVLKWTVFFSDRFLGGVYLMRYYLQNNEIILTHKDTHTHTLCLIINLTFRFQTGTKKNKIKKTQLFWMIWILKVWNLWKLSYWSIHLIISFAHIKVLKSYILPLAHKTWRFNEFRSFDLSIAINFVACAFLW